MKINFAAFAALVLANVIPQTAVYAQGAPPGQPYIQVPIPGIPGVGQPPPEQRRYQGGEAPRCDGTSPATLGIDHQLGRLD
jgi:hypothetical protein